MLSAGTPPTFRCKTVLSGSGTQVINPNTYWPKRLSIG
ncbi:UNVERIFIED_CONTAM: hypothetical protein RKD50_003911 [Streptomyces canus]